MIQLVLFLFVGVMLLFSLVFLSLRRGPRTEGSSSALVDARQALKSLQAGLLPADLVHRIFAKDDLEYLRSEAPVHVQEMFYRERKIIALAWVSQMRSQIRRLMRFHLGSARFYAQLSMKTEMALAMDCGIVLCECRLLQALLYFCGPYTAPRIVDRTANAASRICRISEDSLSFLNSVQHNAFQGPTTGSASL